jgi:hypothetical protein
MSTTDDISNNEQLLVSTIGLSPHLPSYPERTQSYVQDVLSKQPDVLMVRGCLDKYPSVIKMLQDYGNVHISNSLSKLGYRNATVFAPYLKLIDSNAIPLIGGDDIQHVQLAPDCLVDTINYHGYPICFYNLDSISGPFFESHRTFIASIVDKDAYMKKRKNPAYRSALFVLGGDLHTTPDSESVLMMEGKLTKKGYCPSAWVDVWGEMKTDPGVTERSLDVFDSGILLGSLVRPKRKTYFMTYGDVFGRAGSPLKIDRNGMDSTDDGIPYSSTYGLDMTLYVPDNNVFNKKEG